MPCDRLLLISARGQFASAHITDPLQGLRTQAGHRAEQSKAGVSASHVPGVCPGNCSCSEFVRARHTSAAVSSPLCNPADHELTPLHSSWCSCRWSNPECGCFGVWGWTVSAIAPCPPHWHLAHVNAEPPSLRSTAPDAGQWTRHELSAFRPHSETRAVMETRRMVFSEEKGPWERSRVSELFGCHQGPSGHQAEVPKAIPGHPWGMQIPRLSHPLNSQTDSPAPWFTALTSRWLFPSPS